jgi:hypothetical protein
MTELIEAMKDKGISKEDANAIIAAMKKIDTDQPGSVGRYIAALRSVQEHGAPDFPLLDWFYRAMFATVGEIWSNPETQLAFQAVDPAIRSRFAAELGATQ